MRHALANPPHNTSGKTNLSTTKTRHFGRSRCDRFSAPVGFVRKRWQDLVFTDGGLDRRFYELCALAELKNALRSGDVWVQGSRQFRDFDEYSIPLEKFNALLHQGGLALAITTERERYLKERMLLLQQQFENVDRIAQANELPDAIITASGLRITPLANAVPDEAHILVHRAYALLPHVKITELLLEVDEWTGFTRHFTHLKSGDTAKDRILLLAVISPTSTRRFIRKSSMPLFATRPTCWTACSTMNPTCGSKSIIPTQPASPITYSLSCIFSAIVSLRASAISLIEGFMFPIAGKTIPR